MTHRPNMDRFSERRNEPWHGRYNPDEPEDETPDAQTVKLQLEQDKERMEFLKGLNRHEITGFERTLIDSMARHSLPLDFSERVMADDIRKRHIERQVNAPKKLN